MKQFCTFYLKGLFFGIDVLEVQEVILYHEMTQVPLAPASVRGLINLRGQIVTAIDLRQRLQLGPRDDETNVKNVVIQTEDGAISLLVDEIGDVIEPDESQFEDTPETVSGIARKMIKGVYKLDGQLMLILDTHRAIDLEEDSPLSWIEPSHSTTTVY